MNSSLPPAAAFGTAESAASSSCDRRAKSEAAARNSRTPASPAAQLTPEEEQLRLEQLAHLRQAAVRSAYRSSPSGGVFSRAAGGGTAFTEQHYEVEPASLEQLLMASTAAPAPATGARALAPTPAPEADEARVTVAALRTILVDVGRDAVLAHLKHIGIAKAAERHRIANALEREVRMSGGLDQAGGGAAETAEAGAMEADDGLGTRPSTACEGALTPRRGGDLGSASPRHPRREVRLAYGMPLPPPASVRGAATCASTATATPSPRQARLAVRIDRGADGVSGRPAVPDGVAAAPNAAADGSGGSGGDGGGVSGGEGGGGDGRGGGHSKGESVAAPPRLLAESAAARGLSARASRAGHPSSRGRHAPATPLPIAAASASQPGAAKAERWLHWWGDRDLDRLPQTQTRPPNALEHQTRPSTPRRELLGGACRPSTAPEGGGGRGRGGGAAGSVAEAAAGSVAKVVFRVSAQGQVHAACVPEAPAAVRLAAKRVAAARGTDSAAAAARRLLGGRPVQFPRAQPHSALSQQDVYAMMVDHADAASAEIWQRARTAAAERAAVRERAERRAERQLENAKQAAEASAFAAEQRKLVALFGPAFSIPKPAASGGEPRR